MFILKIRPLFYTTNYVPLAACSFRLGSESVYFIFEANITLCFITISTINFVYFFSYHVILQIH